MRRPLRALGRSAVLGGGGALVAALIAAARARPEHPPDAGAEAPPPLPPGRTVPVRGRGEMFVRELAGPSSHAPAIVLLHGWMYPSDLHWFRLFDQLASVGRVIAPDHRGHGRGPRPSKPFRLVDVADDVAALLRELGAAPAILVGYSMGGAVAQLVWQRHPEVVEGLVLCATSDVYSDSWRWRWLWRGMGVLQVGLRLLPRHWLERTLLAQAQGRLPVGISRTLSPATPREVVDVLPWMVGEFDRGSAEDLAEAGRELSRFDARGWTVTIDVPTAVIVSTRDRLVPPRWQRDLASRIPGASITELDMDHDGVVARCDALAPALHEAVTRIRARR